MTRQLFLESIREQFKREMERFRLIAEAKHIHTVSFNDPIDETDDLYRPYAPNGIRHGKAYRATYQSSIPLYGIDRRFSGHVKPKLSLEQMDQDCSWFGRCLADGAA